VPVNVISGARKGLHDGGIHATFVHAANHVFLGSIETEDAALTEMCMGVDNLGH